MARSNAWRSPSALPVEARCPLAASSRTRRPKARPGAAGCPLSSRDGAIGEVLVEVALDQPDQRSHGLGGVGPARAKLQDAGPRHLGGPDLDHALGIDPWPELGCRAPYLP